MIILKLKKTTPEAWSTLLAAPPPAQPDPSAMGGLGGMDMESMMKSMAGMAGVPDFSLALNRLESDDLAKLRGRFAKMGVE